MKIPFHEKRDDSIQANMYLAVYQSHKGQFFLRKFHLSINNHQQQQYK
jgi:hypothetical protein